MPRPLTRPCRYQEQSDQLQIENIKLAEDLENEKLTLRDVNEFLQNELKARSITANALESKVYELSNMLEDNKKTHEVGDRSVDARSEADPQHQSHPCLHTLTCMSCVVMLNCRMPWASSVLRKTVRWRRFVTDSKILNARPRPCRSVFYVKARLTASPQ